MTDLDEFAAEIALQVTREMMGRLETPFSDRDAAAVSTAITKATLRALLRGGIHGADQINERWRALAEEVTGQRVEADLDFHVDVEIPDLWAELYGSEQPDA